MKAKFAVFFAFCCILQADSPAFWDPNQCSGCHKDQVRDWRSSWHSKSHEFKNTLLHESINFVARARKEAKEKVSLECADCHNPRLEIKQVDEDYIYAKMFDLQTKKTRLIDEALRSDHVQNGISCYVCHRIESIKPKLNHHDVGYKIINWISDNTMAGPFPHNDRTIFHKTAQKDHYIDSNQLCEICHQGQGNDNEFSLYNTGAELDSVRSEKKCVDCHMGEQKEGVNAPGIGDGQIRRIRPHLFIGARSPKLVEESMLMKIDKFSKTLSIENTIPHKVPSGFGSRAISLNLTFKRRNDVIGTETIWLKADFRDEFGNTTLPYTAQKLASDTRLNPLETRRIHLQMPDRTTSVVMLIEYYLLEPELIKRLNLEKNNEYGTPKRIGEKIFELQ